MESCAEEVSPASDGRAIFDALREGVRLYGLLYHAAFGAFGTFQETVARSIELAIARLLDAPANWSEAIEHLATLWEHCKLIVARPHEKVGRAVDLSLGTVLDPPTWSAIDEAFAAISKLTKRVDATLRGEGVVTVYEMVVLPDDGDDLIAALERAQAYWDDQRAKRGLPPLRP